MSRRLSQVDVYVNDWEDHTQIVTQIAHVGDDRINVHLADVTVLASSVTRDEAIWLRVDGVLYRVEQIVAHTVTARRTA